MTDQKSRESDGYDDQDAGPASRPTGAAAVDADADEDTDAGPASQPQD